MLSRSDAAVHDIECQSLDSGSERHHVPRINDRPSFQMFEPLTTGEAGRTLVLNSSLPSQHHFRMATDLVSIGFLEAAWLTAFSDRACHASFAPYPLF